MEKKVLIEQRNIVESKTDEDKRLYLYGVFMEADTKNQNGRVYTMDTIKDVMNKINEAAKAGNGILGELDHPETLTVSAKNVAIQLKEAELKGNQLYCKALVLPTPAGKIVRDLVEAGVSVGVSSRGAGNVVEGVVRDYEFVTIDVVINPSVKSAVPSSIYEGYQLTGGSDFADAIKNDLEAQEYFKNELLKVIKELA